MRKSICDFTLSEQQIDQNHASVSDVTPEHSSIKLMIRGGARE
jgi:hypothetical protein